MITVEHQITIEELPEKCFVIFSTKQCLACNQLLTNLSFVTPKYPVYLVEGPTGAKLGPLFSIFSAPTTLFINQTKEYDRLMGQGTQISVKKFFEDPDE